MAPHKGVSLGRNVECDSCEGIHRAHVPSIREHASLFACENLCLSRANISAKFGGTPGRASAIADHLSHGRRDKKYKSASGPRRMTGTLIRIPKKSSDYLKAWTAVSLKDALTYQGSFH